jgi:rare lipoprotein A (peptidoglycan hydrolase)
MKKSVLFGIFCLTLTGFGFAQALVAEGMGSWYDEGIGLFASHASLPFGAELIVTNLENGKRIAVHVGGRIPQDRRWIVDLSPAAADILGMNASGFTPIRIEEVVRVAAAPKVLRVTSVRNFHQNGRAVIQPAGMELTAGHPSLTMGRQVRITNRANGQRVVATVKSRVRASADRIVEVSQAVAQALGARGSYIDVMVDSIDN